MKLIVIEMLKAMGLPAVHIKTIEDNWDKPDFKIDSAPIISDFVASQRTLYEQDQEIISKIDKNVKGRERDIAERLIKQKFGLTHEETKDMDFPAILDLAKTKSFANQNKTVEELQNKLLEKENELKKVKEEEIPQLKGQVDADRKKMKIDAAFEKEANALAKKLIEKNPKALRVPFETALETARLLLSKDTEFDFDDKNILVAIDPTSKLKKKNSAGTGFLVAEEALMDIWKANKFISESNADDVPPPPKPPVGPGNDQDDPDDKLAKKFTHLEAAKKHLEGLKTPTPPAQ